MSEKEQLKFLAGILVNPALLETPAVAKMLVLAHSHFTDARALWLARELILTGTDMVRLDRRIYAAQHHGGWSKWWGEFRCYVARRKAAKKTS